MDSGKSTVPEIKRFYLNQHDLLSKSYYQDKTLSKEEFDILHGQVWSSLNDELKLKGFIKEPAPVRDLAKELDELKAEVTALKMST